MDAIDCLQVLAPLPQTAPMLVTQLWGGFPNWDGKAAFLAPDEEGGGYRRFGFFAAFPLFCIYRRASMFVD